MQLCWVWHHKKQIFQKLGKLDGLSERAGGSIFDVNSSHSLGKVLLKSAVYSMLQLFWVIEVYQKLSNQITPRKKIKIVTNKYLDQALETFTSDLSKKILSTGGAIDIHKVIGKLPKPARGWMLPGHKCTGWFKRIRPYNNLYSQVKFDPKTGQILEIYDQPTGASDAIAMQHDVDYSVCGDDKKC